MSNAKDDVLALAGCLLLLVVIAWLFVGLWITFSDIDKSSRGRPHNSHTSFLSSAALGNWPESRRVLWTPRNTAASVSPNLKAAAAWKDMHTRRRSEPSPTCSVVRTRPPKREGARSTEVGSPVSSPGPQLYFVM